MLTLSYFQILVLYLLIMVYDCFTQETDPYYYSSATCEQDKTTTFMSHYTLYADKKFRQFFLSAYSVYADKKLSAYTLHADKKLSAYTLYADKANLFSKALICFCTLLRCWNAIAYCFGPRCGGGLNNN